MAKSQYLLESTPSSAAFVDLTSFHHPTESYLEGFIRRIPCFLSYLKHSISHAVMVQRSITSFWKSGPASAGVQKTYKKTRTTALSPGAVQQLKGDAALETKAQTETNHVAALQAKAQTEANRVAARAKQLARMHTNVLSKDGLATLLQPSWRDALSDVLKQPFWDELVKFVAAERKAGTIYPPPENVFSAFEHSTFTRTRVVIIGQDPYHQPRQAHGMSFSVPEGVFPPPSLINIFQELETDIPGFKRPSSGCLEKWANQGVLLLNAVLTVRRGCPGSHANRGWERFTDAVVYALSHRNGPGCVFMLWGGYAKKKGASINRTKHHVLTSVHPSPLSANRGGWFGNQHFSKANAFLKKTKQDPIDWIL